MAGCMVVLSGVCWLILTQGGWLAWIPGIMAIAFTTSGMLICSQANNMIRTVLKDRS
jgi:CHASE2 domain-containing sensor protein